MAMASAARCRHEPSDCHRAGARRRRRRVAQPAAEEARRHPRGSGFLAGQHGYRLTAQGLRLFPRLADIPTAGGYPLGDDRITTGLTALDEMLGGGVWPGSATMIAGPSGSGKTIMGLHFIYGGAQHGEPGVIATLQENPTQLRRMLGGLGWPLTHPSVEVMYRSPVDIHIDEWVHDLLHAVDHAQARRR